MPAPRLRRRRPGQLVPGARYVRRAGDGVAPRRRNPVREPGPQPLQQGSRGWVKGLRSAAAACLLTILSCDSSSAPRPRPARRRQALRTRADLPPTRLTHHQGQPSGIAVPPPHRDDHTSLRGTSPRTLVIAVTPPGAGPSSFSRRRPCSACRPRRRRWVIAGYVEPSGRRRRIWSSRLLRDCRGRQDIEGISAGPPPATAPERSQDVLFIRLFAAEEEPAHPFRRVFRVFIWSTSRHRTIIECPGTPSPYFRNPGRTHV